MVAPDEGGSSRGQDRSRSFELLAEFLRELAKDRMGDVDKVESGEDNPNGLPDSLIDEIDSTLAEVLMHTTKALECIRKVDSALALFERRNKLSSSVAGRHRACLKWTCTTVLSQVFDVMRDIKPSSVTPTEIALKRGEV